jgi:MFS family permease
MEKQEQRIINRKTFFLLSSIFFYAISLGINLVIFPTLLIKQKADAFQIGLSSFIEIISVIFASFFIRKIIKKFGLIKSLFFALSIFSLIILIIFFYKNFYLWLFLIFLMGPCWIVCVIIRQSWLNFSVDENNRGIINGIYSMIISAGLAIGPLIVKFFGAQRYCCFIISAIMVIASMLILLPIRNQKKIIFSEKKISPRKFLTTNPISFIARFFLDFQSSCSATFTVLFGIKIGFSSEDSGLLISAFMASGFADIWIGFLLKKHHAYKIITAGFFGCFFCFLIVGLVAFRLEFLQKFSYQILVIIYFILGIFAACIYVSSITTINNYYEGEELISANSTLQAIGSFGALFGGFAGGLLINSFGIIGFPITLIAPSILFLIFYFFYAKKA